MEIRVPPPNPFRSTPDRLTCEDSKILRHPSCKQMDFFTVANSGDFLVSTPFVSVRVEILSYRCSSF